MKNRSSGTWGVAALIVAGVVGFALRKVLPSFGRMLLWGAVLGGVLLLLLVGVVLYFAFAKDEKKEENGISLSGGRAKLMEIRRMGMRIRDPKIKACNEEICGVADRIFAALREQPEDLHRMRQLFSYYLPTWANILQKYLRLEAGGIADPRMTESMILCLGDIRSAMDKLHQNLFENYALDLAVEMEVLTMVAKRDGLL